MHEREAFETAYVNFRHTNSEPVLTVFDELLAWALAIQH